MSTSKKHQGEVKRWHVILFDTIAALLLILVLFGSGRDLLLLPGQSGFPSIIHRWHEAQSGAFMTILFGGSLLALLWKPQNKPLLMQYILLSIGIVCLFFAIATGAGFMPIVLAIGVVFIAILAFAYPRPRDLLNFRSGASLSYPLLAITVVAAILLAATFLILTSVQNTHERSVVPASSRVAMARGPLDQPSRFGLTSAPQALLRHRS